MPPSLISLSILRQHFPKFALQYFWKMKLVQRFLLSILLLSGWAYAQSASDRMKEHISYLSSDALEGRETGTPAELVAADYVKGQFEGIGLKPKGTNGGWLQEFDFLNKLKTTAESRLSIGDEVLTLDKDFQIFPQSGNGELKGRAIPLGYGIHAPELGHDDYKAAGDVAGKIVVIMRGSPDGDNPHGKFTDYAPLDVKIATAVKMGVKGIIFVQPENQQMEVPVMNYSRKSARESMPIIFLHYLNLREILDKEINGVVGLEEDMKKGHNVIGYLDNGQKYTVIFGAHMDHLGFGDEGSLHRGEKAIHNGADDNASGVAMIIELAREIKGNPAHGKYNYLFIAFSGEEKGLLGSNFFSKNPTINFADVSCMLNFDMVGRLDPEKNTLGVNAVGTSPFWKEALGGIQIDDMKVKTAESGVGPSDHTSFYLKDLPVLHFFSGTHADYHKPSDDENLINYAGTDKIYRYVVALLDKLNANGGKLEFTQTKNDEEGDAPRWKVSLGVVPDYLYDGEGMRIDGVTEGKPASKAGLLAGDVVIKMDDNDVKDMMSYMRALAKYNKGDTVKVVVLRKGKPKKKKVIF
jgi:aminopeptidase YwaD